MQFHRDVAAHYQYQEHRARSSNKLYTFILITIVWRGRTQVELLKVDKMSFNPDVRGFFGLLGCAPQPHHAQNKAADSLFFAAPRSVA